MTALKNDKGKPRAVEIENDDETPVAVLASEIKALSLAATKLAHGPLRRDAIVVLLADATKLSRRDIRRVLDAMQTLGLRYTK